MKTIRRLYFYLVAFISMEIVLWGLIGVARTIFSQRIGFSADNLAYALAQIVVGVPVFGIHWWWAQRNAKADAAEHSAGLRAFFLYAALFALFVPVVQSVWAVLNRLFLQFADIAISRAVLGGSQTLSDNLIAIVMNSLIGVYFLKELRQDWATVNEKSSLRFTRRIYRYLWVLYALALSIGGTQQVLRYLFSALIDSGNTEWFLNGLALLIVGAPLWAWMWKTVQDALNESSERTSLLRLGVLYFLTLASVITVLTSASITIYEILEALFNNDPFNEMFRAVRGALSVAIPFGTVWIYYGSWLTRDLDAVPDAPRRAGMKRLYAYILAAIGLAASFSGVTLLLSYFSDQLRDGTYLTGNVLSNALAILIVGLPLWYRMWRPIQAEAHADDESGLHARRSIIRKIYLYLAIFAGVIGGMVAAVRLISLLLSALLSDPAQNFLAELLDALEKLVLFGGLLIYHWKILQGDGMYPSAQAEGTQTTVNALYLADVNDPHALQLATLIEAECPEINLILQPHPDTDVAIHAVLLSETRLLKNDAKLTAWLSQFNGTKLIVTRAAGEWFYAENPAEIVQSLRGLAAGDSQPQKNKTPAWMIAVYILAGMMVFEILFILAMLLLEAFGL